MPLIREVQGTPGGGSQVVEREYSGRDVIIRYNGTKYRAAFTEEMEMTEDQKTQSLTDDCGRTETDAYASYNPDITISGVVTEESTTFREDDKVITNLSHDTIKELNGQLVIVESPLESGEYILKSYTLTDSDGVVDVNYGTGWEYAFEFQVQLKKPET